VIIIEAKLLFKIKWLLCFHRAYELTTNQNFGWVALIFNRIKTGSAKLCRRTHYSLLKKGLLFHKPLLGASCYLRTSIVSELQTFFTIKEKMWTTYVVVALSARHVHIYPCCLTLLILYCSLEKCSKHNGQHHVKNYVYGNEKFPMGEG